VKQAGKHAGAVVSSHAGDDNNHDDSTMTGGGGGGGGGGGAPADRLCEKAMEIFVSAYGSETGVAALKFLPFGGLYLAGGVTVKNIKHIQNEKFRFMKSFHEKGRLSPAIDKIPLYVVMDQSLGQRGAHYAAIKFLSEFRE
jgi:glucokinase